MKGTGGEDRASNYYGKLLGLALGAVLIFVGIVAEGTRAALIAIIKEESLQAYHAIRGPSPPPAETGSIGPLEAPPAATPAPAPAPAMPLAPPPTAKEAAKKPAAKKKETAANGPSWSRPFARIGTGIDEFLGFKDFGKTHQ